MINLALIGLGKWGKNYLETVKKIPDVKIKYICAVTTKTLDKYSSKYIKTTNYLDLLSRNDLNGVIIATPAATHYKIAQAFLKRRIPVLVEKPLTLTYLDAKKLVALARRQQTSLMIGHIYLYHPAFIKLLQLLPKLGHIEYIECEAGNFGPFRKDISPLWDWLPHDLSMCLKIIKQKPKIVSISKQYQDHIYKIILKVGEIDINININNFLPTRKRKITVIGDKGILIFDDTQQKKLYLYKITKNNLTPNPIFIKYKSMLPLENEVRIFINHLNEKIKIIDVNQAVGIIKLIYELEHQIKISI
jgi:UDP-2-acetamido-3-amino-2,3-dideoxy-glucuronate N-acetyltransferase